jgi:hypothetical protein
MERVWPDRIVEENNLQISEMSAVLPHLEITPQRPDWLAGAPGFEPRHRCGHAGQRKGVAHMLTATTTAQLIETC